MKLRITALSFLWILAMVVGCNKKPSVSEIFKTQLMKFLEEGTRINAKASLGVSFLELREQLANTKAAYDLTSSTWPAILPIDCSPDFEKALKGWDLTLELWKLKIKSIEDKYAIYEPTQPNINDFQKYIEFAESDLVIKLRKKEDNLLGRRYLPFDENISVLLAVSSTAFDSGRDKILQALHEK